MRGFKEGGHSAKRVREQLLESEFKKKKQVENIVVSRLASMNL